MPIRILGLLALMFLLSGCGDTAPPVRLVGESADLQGLTGTWRGSFRNTELGHGGQIDFRMSAAGDSAFGEVVMYLERPEEPIWSRPGGIVTTPNSSPSGAPTWMRIRFVRVEGGNVSGRMEPVYEPHCDCWTEASFLGRLRGARIEGSYTSRSADGRFESSGSWQAERVSDP